jgi:hypothetical protein
MQGLQAFGASRKNNNLLRKRRIEVHEQERALREPAGIPGRLLQLWT